MIVRLFLIILSSLILSSCSLVPKKSGLEVISYPPAKVYINNKEMGMTPYKNSTLQPGEVEVRLTTNGQQWIKKIELQNNINTVIDWEFGKEEKHSGGYVLYLEKTGDSNKAGLMVNTIPGKATVFIDNEVKGYSPFRLNDIIAGDRQLTLSFPGYKNLNVYMKAVNGYQLVIDGVLGAEETTVNETQQDNNQPTPSIAISSNTVTIKETETGWLRVRESSSNNSREITKVNPNEKYPLLDEIQDWYKIDLGDGKSGWVSSKYAEKSK
jgi:hypothetical protein